MVVRRHRLQEQNRTDGGDGGEGAGNRRQSPAEVNAAANRSRLSRIEEIGRVADGRRAAEMRDVDGERTTGAFSGGEFDDSPEARERAAAQAEAEAAQALEEQRERAQLEQEEEEREARRLQGEGGREAADGDETSPGDAQGDDSQGNQPGDERVVGGVRHYLTIVDGQERWLTLAQLRERAGATINAEETLQRAQEALQRSSQTDQRPKPDPVEVPDEKDLENIILSASMGDEEAVRKLAQVVRSRPQGVNPQDVSRQVAQQIATQRLIDQGEDEQKELLGNANLGPIFRLRLNEFASKKPKTPIVEAYKTVGDQMRKDFAPMLQQSSQRPPLNKADRKRTIVNPPASAGRQARREEDDREVPVSDQIDAIARTRGQQRAHRIRRS